MTITFFALQRIQVMSEVAVEDGVRNLLVGIDQPAFPYRNFNHPDHAPLLAKWPLMALIAQLPEMRSAPLGQIKTAASKATRPLPHVRGVQTESAVRPNFLGNYDSKSAQPVDDPAKDVRSLLGRLSEDRR